MKIAENWQEISYDRTVIRARGARDAATGISGLQDTQAHLS